MIKKFELLSLHTEVEGDVQAYVREKLANLDRYIPTHSRNTAHLEVRLHEEKIGGKLRSVCEATLHLPRRIISLKERAETFFAAIDAVKARLKLLIQKYKNEYTNNKRRRHVAARFKRRLSTLAGLSGEAELTPA